MPPQQRPLTRIELGDRCYAAILSRVHGFSFYARQFPVALPGPCYHRNNHFTVSTCLAGHTSIPWREYCQCATPQAHLSPRRTILVSITRWRCMGSEEACRARIEAEDIQPTEEDGPMRDRDYFMMTTWMEA
ncbi:uncharacterized protein L3040_008691 [Drepanopeziza brunnea f. sp. 'multigermtubi']|uniref:Uncharacterized protein n=1 Tax=Marssonina brunnea f. sp. multigermtubi (strain MB_m1) TaxID=1072389 RepID=K1Y0Z6_MARBU|nr:uncharacterized protein MBM_03051 [Drepanopeziza brunnea f. sp. 'multigermtubi' MB_m1]EKD18809.1 hypothetical protein MBM_03051 [Drepanopeziza brunnea f. sp. 'multigermtubi' MB_m1]KAJ5033579.1 hypothetical protein L3040_008691 [Drepanopeziza brunnea f. sp. 'multigermtubi']